jgi:hypothetical protein
MVISNVNSSDEKQHTTSHPTLVVMTIALALLFSGTIVSGLFPATSITLDVGAHTAFAQIQQQNQTNNMTTTGNNTTNTTIAAASSYNEMLNPRQTEYSEHLGFNDLHIEAIRHIDLNATQAANQSGQQKARCL